MPRHTPGPWSAHEYDDGGWYIYAGGGWFIEGDALVAETPGHTGTHEANAYLIAAAPELLEAAQALLIDLKAHDDAGLDCSAGVALRAAIAKATGGQP